METNVKAVELRELWQRYKEDGVPFAEFQENLVWFLSNRRAVAEQCVSTLDRADGRVHVLTIVDR